MKFRYILSIIVFSILLLTGCNVGAPASTNNIDREGDTDVRGSQETTASIEVIGNEETSMGETADSY